MASSEKRSRNDEENPTNSNYKLDEDHQTTQAASRGIQEESKQAADAPKINQTKNPHIQATTLFDKSTSNGTATKLIANSRSALIANDSTNQQDSRQEKFAEFLRTEKLKRYKRVPRVYQKRTPQNIKCPNCGKERQTRTRYETTGTQWCTCIVCCWLGAYILCCIPFCCKRCFNVKHVCRECFYQIGESGF